MRKTEKSTNFSISYVKKIEAFEGFLFTENLKAHQIFAIQSKIIKLHADMFTNHLFSGFNNSVTN